MNNAQKSKEQANVYTNVITQWTSYFLRTMETTAFGGETLTKLERARMFLATSLFWGIGATGLRDKWPNLGETDSEVLNYFITNGVDTALDSTLGVKFGDRVAFNPIEIIERAKGTYSDPFETIPAFNITSDTADAALGVVTNAFSGRYAASSHELTRLVRAWKIIDSPIIAYTMMMEDVRRTRTGSTIEGPFTTSQEFFQAIGITPSEVVDKSRAYGIMIPPKRRKALAVEKAFPYFQAGINAIKSGDYSKGQSLILDADAIVQGYGLPDTYLAEVREELYRKFGFNDMVHLMNELKFSI